ncbi:MAG: hypothetical protein GC154_02010 [bacterium]|nr:hypothetical protein [bacterium]
MKKFNFTLCIFLLCSSAFAQSVSFQYVTEVPTPPELGIPLGVAVDANGGLYYTILSIGSNLSGCLYVADPLSAPPASEHVYVDDGLDFNMPNGRGITGVDVDSQGNVYMSFDTGTASSSSLRKRGPAPDFALVSDFGVDGVFGQRFEAASMLNADIVMGVLFDTVNFYDSHTGELLHTVGGGETYQRDAAYNPATNDIYLAKNRDVAGYPISAANLLSGGSPDNLAGYASIQPGFIPQGGQGGQYGTKHQKLGYDPVNDLIMVPTYTGEAAPGEGETYQLNVAFYHPSDTSTPVARIDASDSPNGPLLETGDVESAQIDGETYVFISDSRRDDNVKRILVYKMMTGSSSAKAWDLYN